MNEALPRPFRKLRRPDVGRCVEQDDGSAAGKTFDHVVKYGKLSRIRIVQGVKNHALEPLQPFRLTDVGCSPPAAILRIHETKTLQKPIVVFQVLRQRGVAGLSKLCRTDSCTFKFRQRLERVTDGYALSYSSGNQRELLSESGFANSWS